MTRTSGILKKIYSSPHLYREDLEEIEEILQKDFSARDFHIEYNDRKYKSIKDISEDASRVTKLTISSHSPTLHLIIDRHSNQLFTYSDDVSAAAAIAKIDQIISNCDREWFPFTQKIAGWTTLFSWILLSSITSFLEVYFKNNELQLSVSQKSLLFVLLIIAISSLIMWFIPFSPKIEFQHKNKSKGFLQRNKDAIMLALFSATVAAILTRLLS